jgi:hypothetical protein
MDLLKTINDYDKKHIDFLIAQGAYYKETALLSASIIEYLYSNDICENLKLSVNIQEEDHGSLFTQPALYIKLKNKDYWLKKNSHWIDEFFYLENDLFVEYENDQLTEIYKEQKTETRDENTHCLLYTLNQNLTEYSWDGFTNVDSFNSSLWNKTQTERQLGTKEYHYIGDLSYASFIDLLSHINYQYIKKDDITNLIVHTRAEKLEQDLSHKSTQKVKNKI